MTRLFRKKILVSKGAHNSSKKIYNHTNYIIRKLPTGLNPNHNPNPKVWKNVTKGNPAFSDLKSSKSDGNETKTKSITNFYWQSFDFTKVPWKMPLTFLLLLLRVSYWGWIGKCSKGEISHPAPLKVLFSPNNFSQFSNAVYNVKKN